MPLQDDTLYISANKTVILKLASPITSKPITGTPEILMDFDPSKVMLTCEGKFEESNLFVETENGHYSFVVIYKPTIKKTVYVFGTPSLAVHQPVKNTSESTSESKQSTTKESAATDLIYKMKCAEVIKKANEYSDLGMIKKGMEFSLNGVYVKGDQLYFKVTTRNTGNIKYDIDFYKFVVRTKKGSVKKAAVQETVIVPVYVYNESIEVINGKSSLTKVFVVDKFTMADNKKLFIELWEKNGDRLLEVELDDDRLIKAKTL